MSRLPTVCILAGGLGTRLGPMTATRPKPLIEVAGRPFIVHQLQQLSDQGATNVVLCVGFLGEQIEAEIGTSQFGMTITYSYDGPELAGTLGAIRQALPLLGDSFLVLYGDTYLPIDFGVVSAALEDGAQPAVMTVMHNRGEFDRSNATFDGFLVTAYDKARPTPEMEWIDYGLSGLRQSALAFAKPDEHDLAGLFGPLAEQRLLRGVAVTERFYEIGTPDALAVTEEYLLMHGTTREALRESGT